MFVLNCNWYFSYNICIRKESGYCCVQYYPCSDTGSWSISAPSPAGTDTGTLCSLDYIIINGGMGTCPSSGGSVASNMSYCGTIFSALNAAIATSLICGKYQIIQFKIL